MNWESISARVDGLRTRGSDLQTRLRGLRRVPFEVLGNNPPRDLAFKVLAQ